MLFDSNVAQIFQKLNLQYDSAANQARKAAQAKRLNFYHDEQIDALEEIMAHLFSEPDRILKVELNICKKIINNLAQVYRNPPIRTIEGGTDKDTALYEAIVVMSNLNSKMKQASRYTKLLKSILLRPVWRNGKLDIDVLTGNILDVVVGDVPEDLREIIITDYGPSGKIEEVEYSVWTAEEWQRLDYMGNILAEEPNPYKVLPFIPCFDYPPTGSSFWLSGGKDLIYLQDMVNVKIVDLCYLLQQQSYGVGYIKGSPGGGNLRVDPGTMVELPEGGEIGFESQKAELRAVLEVIDRIIKWSAVMNGLSSSSVDVKPTRDMSGVAKLVDTEELSEMREDDKQTYRAVEKDLFQLIKIVWNVHNTKYKLSENTILGVDFADPRPPVDPEKQAKAWDLELAQGIISPVDIALIKNPDLGTRENALAHLIQVQQEMKALQET